jgi:predicted nucleotidyltransferase
MGITMPEMGTKARRRTSLANALFSSTQQRVLGLLFGHPDRTFFANEIIRGTGAGSGSVQRELSRLVESGLVIVTPVGNQKHYQANRSAPVFHELRAIILKTSGLADPLRAALLPLASRIELALIYGSVAKGADHAGSDIDVLVVAGDLALETLFARLAPVEKQLGRRISPTLYTPEEFRRRRERNNPFLTKVLAGEQIVLIGSQDAVGAA